MNVISPFLQMTVINDKQAGCPWSSWQVQQGWWPLVWIVHNVDHSQSFSTPQMSRLLGAVPFCGRRLLPPGQPPPAWFLQSQRCQPRSSTGQRGLHELGDTRLQCQPGERVDAGLHPEAQPGHRAEPQERRRQHRRYRIRVGPSRWRYDWWIDWLIHWLIDWLRDWLFN